MTILFCKTAAYDVFILVLQYNALIHSQQERATLIDLINKKEVLGDLFNQLRLALQRRTEGRPAQVSVLDLAYDYSCVSVDLTSTKIFCLLFHGCK